MDDRVASDPGAEALAREIVTFLEAEPRYFVEVLERFRTHEYRTLLLAWSRLREERRLARDPIGRYVLASSDGPRQTTANPTG